MIDIFVLYGPPGAGKGTICKKLPSGKCLSVGQIFRDKGLGTDGRLVDDTVVNQLLMNELLLRQKQDYVVLDGYPRTLNQAEFLKTLPYVHLQKVFYLDCPDAAVIDRVCRRETCPCGASYHPTLKPSAVKGVCDLCGQKLFHRLDDTEEVIQRRLDRFHEETDKILPCFKDKVAVVDINTDFRDAVARVVSEITSLGVEKSRRARLETLAQQKNLER